MAFYEATASRVKSPARASRKGIGGAREHLSHEDYDTLDAAIGGLPQALNEKLLQALASGEFENLQEVVEHLADGLSAKQMQFLGRAIDELPARVRDEIDI